MSNFNNELLKEAADDDYFEKLRDLKVSRDAMAARVRNEFNGGAPPTGTWAHCELLKLDAAIAKAEGK